MKPTNRFIWVIVIIFQMILGTGVGLLFLSNTDVEPRIISNKVGEITLEDVSIEESQQIISQYYSDWIKNGSLKVEIDNIPFSIPYSDIEVKIDIDKTMDNLVASLPKNSLETYFYDTSRENVLVPVYTYNSGKLVRRCEELFSQYETEPTPESYEVENGILKAIAGSPGLDIDYKLFEQELGKRIFNPNGALSINRNNSSILLKVFSEPIYDEIFNTIASSSSINYPRDLGNITESVFDRFDNVVVENGAEIKLSSLLDFSRFEDDMERDLLNRLATVLYQVALPLDGIKVINRKPAQRPVSYSQPGLEAVIEGEEADLILKNETGNALLLLAEISDNEVMLYFASTGSVKSGLVTVEESDYVAPSVITIVNGSLSPNASIVISEGIPGFTAHIIRTVDGVSEEISKDKYLPISKTVETAARPENLGSK